MDCSNVHKKKRRQGSSREPKIVTAQHRTEKQIPSSSCSLRRYLSPFPKHRCFSWSTRLDLQHFSRQRTYSQTHYSPRRFSFYSPYVCYFRHNKNKLWHCRIVSHCCIAFVHCMKSLLSDRTKRKITPFSRWCIAQLAPCRIEVQ